VTSSAVESNRSIPCRRCGCGEIVPTRVHRAGKIGLIIGWVIVATWFAVAGFCGIQAVRAFTIEFNTEHHGPDSSAQALCTLLLAVGCVAIGVASALVPLVAYLLLISKATRQRCDACGW